MQNSKRPPTPTTGRKTRSMTGSLKPPLSLSLNRRRTPTPPLNLRSATPPPFVNPSTIHPLLASTLYNPIGEPTTPFEPPDHRTVLPPRSALRISRHVAAITEPADVQDATANQDGPANQEPSTSSAVVTDEDGPTNEDGTAAQDTTAGVTASPTPTTPTTPLPHLQHKPRTAFRLLGHEHLLSLLETATINADAFAQAVTDALTLLRVESPARVVAMNAYGRANPWMLRARGPLHEDEHWAVMLLERALSDGTTAEEKRELVEAAIARLVWSESEDGDEGGDVGMDCYGDGYGEGEFKIEELDTEELEEIVAAGGDHEIDFDVAMEEE
ncbi:uncharacterized protein K452DRAFT_301606 [Aplosporella prunicola CBS 121167]|uniref:Uncharacterized protein n=1 Tax=Aplosporella prunicola CBS 121167 TaxID=1176127 RepID=A0A6A6B552_9PEZI|nr:uncharacterized protein K452DRAFT_301606 [Aplosporella prunicola CBS 121167]KAF2137881.1 hypothetical protein K452DRAFT_301606 [Aplosporella prunicola CBS 121167]